MSLPFSKGKIKVFISTVSLDKEIKLRQQRVLQCLEARKIPHTVADLALNAADKRELRVLMMGKPQAPPQIFNGNDHCGDYAAFCLALEDEILEEFLKLEDPKSAGKKDEKEEEENTKKVEVKKDENVNQPATGIKEEVNERKNEGSKAAVITDEECEGDHDHDNDNHNDDGDNEGSDDESKFGDDDENNDDDDEGVDGNFSSKNDNEDITFMKVDERSRSSLEDRTIKSPPTPHHSTEKSTKDTHAKIPSPPPPPSLPPPSIAPASTIPRSKDDKMADIPQLPKSLLEDIRNARSLKPHARSSDPRKEPIGTLKNIASPMQQKEVTQDGRPKFTAGELFKGRMALKSKYDRSTPRTPHQPSTGASNSNPRNLLSRTLKRST